MLLVLPDLNNDALQRIYCVSVFDEATAGINKGDVLGGSRSAWTPVLHGRGSITGGEYACDSVTVPIPSASVHVSFNGTYSPFFDQSLRGREEEGIHG